MRTETVTQAMQVCLGEHAIAVGTLTYSRQGARENTLFVYDDTWLENDTRFEISPDLPLTRERYFHKAATGSDSRVRGAPTSTAASQRSRVSVTG